MSGIVAAAEMGMLADTERLRVISHNLANVGTVGFKRELPVVTSFDEHVLREAAGSESGGSSGSPVISYRDTSAGTLTHTGNPLDVALEGDAWFAIDTGRSEAYTRQGTFRLDANGELVTVAGERVATVNGDARLTSPAPQIDSQGNIRDNGAIVGQLKLVTVSNPQSLQEIGNGLYAASDSTVVTPADSARVRQGFTEAANVVTMNEMIGMIETVRHFEASQKLLQGYDAMLDRAITDLGSIQ